MIDAKKTHKEKKILYRNKKLKKNSKKSEKRKFQKVGLRENGVKIGRVIVLERGNQKERL